MPVEAACPSCDGKFRLPDAAAGKKIRCPKCKGPLEVPPLAATGVSPLPEPAKAEPAPEPAAAASKPAAIADDFLLPRTPTAAATANPEPAASSSAGKTVEVACSSCSGKFRLPEAAAGKKIRCPKCKGPVDVPPLAVPSPAPAAAEGLKSAWRSASQEPAPVEMTKSPMIRPQVEKPVVEKKSVEKTAVEKSQPEKVVSEKPIVSSPVAEKPKAEKPKVEKPLVEKRIVEKAPSVASTIDIPLKNPAATTPITDRVAPSAKPSPAVEVTIPASPANKHKFVAPAPTTPQWFFRGEDGEAFGPVDRPTLDAWKAEGRISVDCQVLQQGSDQWQWASDLYPELEEAEEDTVAAPTATEGASANDEAVAEQSSLGSQKSRSAVSSSRRARADGATEEDEDDEEATDETGLSPHSKPVAFLLALTLGWLGIHRFYLGYVGIGLAMLFTFGGLMMWSLTDALRILFGHVPDSEGLKLRD